jgi:hypothetical protein
MEQGGGCAMETPAPTPRVAAVSPPAIAKTLKVVLIESISITPVSGFEPAN